MTDSELRTWIAEKREIIKIASSKVTGAEAAYLEGYTLCLWELEQRLSTTDDVFKRAENAKQEALEQFWHNVSND
jgi:hypothetical protein